MLELRDVAVQAGDFSLGGISLKVAQGSCHVIVGATGSGKTLLLESILGLKRPSRGSILLSGREITDQPLEKRGISYVPQDLALFPHLTVEDNILYGLRMKGVQDPEHGRMVEMLIETVGIKELLQRSIKNLSGGERQRVALVRAIAAGNNHLLLDEPFSALHQGLRRELWYLLKELQKRFSLTVLMVTHDMEEAFFLGERVTVMIDGAIRQTGTARDVYEKPADIEVARFFGIGNIFVCRVKALTASALHVVCDSLRVELTIPMSAARLRPPAIGAPCTLGIRPENVMVLRADRPSHSQENLLAGILTGILLKGASHTLLFLPAGSATVVEIEVPDYVLKKLQLHVGDGISIFFKGETLFLL
ncbi:MAG: ABC transporter ATP-binding protein [Syntrophobacterales bacterium]|nr:ABC transporter ATP-binding protein [Syntrophobacterales bacterium]